MILGSTGDGIHAHSYNAAQQQVTSKARRAATGDFLRQRNYLGLKAFLADCDRDVSAALRLDNTRCDTCRRNIEP